MNKLGRINIITEVSLLFSHLAFPREEYLNAAVHVMVFVCQKYNSSLVYDPSYPEIDHNVFKKCDWSEFYWDAEEAIHVNTSELRCKKVNILFCIISLLTPYFVGKSSLICDIQQIMAMAQWLPLLECHCIQLNY